MKLEVLHSMCEERERKRERKRERCIMLESVFLGRGMAISLTLAGDVL
jgi:hypothetical protein